MIKLLLVVLIGIAFVGSMKGQESVDELKKIHKTSIGLSPLTFVSTPTGKGPSKTSIGFGAVFNLKYSISQRFSSGVYLRYSGIVNAIPGMNGCGTSASLCEETIEDFLAGGFFIEYNFSNRFAINFQGGFEYVDFGVERGANFGGGISYHLKPSKSLKSIHGFGLSLYSSDIHSTAAWKPYPYTGFDQYRNFYSAIVIQINWKIQFTSFNLLKKNQGVDTSIY